MENWDDTIVQSLLDAGFPIDVIALALQLGGNHTLEEVADTCLYIQERRARDLKGTVKDANATHVTVQRTSSQLTNGNGEVLSQLSRSDAIRPPGCRGGSSSYSSWSSGSIITSEPADTSSHKTPFMGPQTYSHSPPPDTRASNEEEEEGEKGGCVVDRMSQRLDELQIPHGQDLSRRESRHGTGGSPATDHRRSSSAPPTGGWKAAAQTYKVRIREFYSSNQVSFIY